MIARPQPTLKQPLALFLSVLSACSVVLSAQAADEPFLKPNDVIALVGGEDMVACAEQGYLETLLQRALPNYHLKFRCLAWEGDTVYEQPRMLNYPTLAQQLEQVRATAIIAQFGQMESLDGRSGIPKFIAAYESLIRTMQKDDSRRRLSVVALPYAGPKDAEVRQLYSMAVQDLPSRLHLGPALTPIVLGMDIGTISDGVHLNQHGHSVAAGVFCRQLVGIQGSKSDYSGLEPLLQLVRAKNRLWERYRRPQNWAFLAGDRVSQPSSRDWRDPNKRWFPEEMEQFVPLIEQKEKEIWELAAKLKEEKK